MKMRPEKGIEVVKKAIMEIKMYFDNFWGYDLFISVTFLQGPLRLFAVWKILTRQLFWYIQNQRSYIIYWIHIDL